MTTPRFFNGSRPTGAKSIGSQLMRLEMKKKGTLTTAERYKYILGKKMDEDKKKVVSKATSFSLPGSKASKRKLSPHAERALKQIAARKAAKAAKKESQMVIITPRVYSNGRLMKDGKFYDLGGNVVGQVNRKNGKISLGSMMGGGLGKYKPGMFTDLLITDAINKHSPFLLHQRKMHALQQQQQALANQEVIDHYGHKADFFHHDYDNHSYDSADSHESSGGTRSSVGSSAWGAVSNNVWGTFSDNAWGTTSENIWGGSHTNVWGSMTGGTVWGKTIQYWGTGNGKNYLKGITNFVAALFGIKTGAGREAFRRNVEAVRSAGASGSTQRGRR